jgi:hypothetical protein
MTRKILAILLCLLMAATLMGNTPFWDTYPDTWVLIDELGRETPTAKETGPVRKDKYVVIFYHIWHGDFMAPTVSSDPQAPRNVSRIIRENEDWHTNTKLWGPNISYHYWGEPLFGYYDLANDEYVIRKHAQMLSDCGVDAIVIDYSNYMGGGGMGYTKKALTNLLNVFNKIRSEGKKTPQVMFLCTWGLSESAKAAQDFYNDFYTKKEYKDLWFIYEGKPLILAHPDYMSDELKSFFTIRKPYPFYTPVDAENTWPWLSLYPQEPGYTQDNPCEVVSVGVAQNWSESLDFMSSQDENGNFIARGRSFTSKNQKLLKNPTSSEYESAKGLNFQESFDRAIELDPTVIFVTAFNEWIAARFLDIPDWAALSKNPTPPFGGFCDVFTTEFSRDIEPTREGGLNDNFYNQLAINIRRFKGTGKQKNEAKPKTITIDGDFGDWDDIHLEYRDDMYDISVRDAKGIGKNHYINTSGRNDFKVCKVTHDNNNVYFYVETMEPLTPFDGPYWMNLFIRVKGKGAHDKSWEGFQFILSRRNVSEDYTRLERSTGGWNWEIVYDYVEYKVTENKMELAIPRYALGIDNTKNIDIEFKWFDNMQHEGDPLEFYLNGDTAPNQRFAYSYRFIGDNKGDKSPALTIALGAGLVVLSILIVIVILISNKKKRGING